MKRGITVIVCGGRDYADAEHVNFVLDAIHRLWDVWHVVEGGSLGADQPWQFGEDASKATCLWLKGLPPLLETTPGNGDRRTRRANQTPSGQNKLGPSADRWKLRSLTYPGIAAAMADQWGALLPAGAAR